jgi:superkiller protein 3
VYYDPQAVLAWEGLADVYWWRDDIQAAIDVIETAIDNNPGDPYLYERLGWFYYEDWNYESAIGALQQSISLDPDWSSAYSTLADIYYELGDYNQALGILEEGVAANPDRSDIWEELGWYYMDYERYDDSLAAFNSASNVDPEYAWPYIGLATVHTILGNWDEANSALLNADTYSYDDPYILEAIGWGYVDLGDCSTAMAYFERTLEVDPYSSGAQEGIDYCSS